MGPRNDKSVVTPHPKFPPHANAKAHAKVMAWLRSATTSEVMTMAVKAGIYQKNGKLARPYRLGRSPKAANGKPV